MIQYVVTPPMGKRLIARAIIRHPAVQEVIKKGTLVVIAGTTNGYVAEEILSSLNQLEGFQRRRFFRGITLPPSSAVTHEGRLPEESGFPGDVVIHHGTWQRGQTLIDVVDHLKEGDVILKGANAVDPVRRQAGILIGHPKGGTIGSALQAVIGRRVRLILPVGLEKRVFSDLNELAGKVNAPGSQGARLFIPPGEILTELDALELLTGVKADLVAAGGVCGAEGAVWLGVTGSPQQLQETRELMAAIVSEPPFML